MRHLLALLAGLICIAACASPTATPQPTSSPTPEPTLSATPNSTPSPTASPSVTPEPATPEPARATQQQLEMTVGDDTRTVELLLPSALETATPEAALPLVVLLHGSPGSAYAIAAPSRADVFAEREGVVVALPSAPGRYWSALWQADEPHNPHIAYVVGMIEQLLERYPIDPQRVYVGGHSAGAVMSGRLACEHADLVAGVLMNAGTDFGGPCQPSRGVSVIAIHGTGDGTYPIDDARAFIAKWRELDECPAPREQAISATANASISDGCADGTAVEIISVEHATHRWFTEPDALPTAFDFWQRHLRGAD